MTSYELIWHSVMAAVGYSVWLSRVAFIGVEISECGRLGKYTSFFVTSKNNLNEINTTQGQDWAIPSPVSWLITFGNYIWKILKGLLAFAML